MELLVVRRFDSRKPEIERGPDHRFYQRKRTRSTTAGEYPWTKVHPTTGVLTDSGTASFPYTETFWDTSHASGYANGQFAEFLERSGGYNGKYVSDWGGPMFSSQSGYKSVFVVGPLKTNVGFPHQGHSYLTPGKLLTGYGPTFAAIQKLDLWAYGAKAINATKPGTSDFSLPTFIGELREGLPRVVGMSILRDKVGIARSAGREYLNVQFGWKPLISDLKDLGSSIVNSQAILESYKRGDGRLQRRRWELPQETLNGISTTTVNPFFGGNTLSAKTNVSWDQTRRIWFSGRFRYHIPQGDALAARWERWNQYGRLLAGLSYDSLPETVWNLAPWSWLADWFGDFGDVLANISLLGSDGVVLDYGYLMCEQEYVIRQRTECTYNSPTAPGVFGGRVGFDYHVRYRQRARASPFGFGLIDTDMTPLQLSILAAVGLSRGSYMEK